MAHGRPHSDGEVGGKDPLFINVARTALERGDAGRATMTIIQGLRRNPERIVSHGHIVLPMLASAVPARGLEDEMITLVLRTDPELGLYSRLVTALEAAGKEPLALAITRAVTQDDTPSGQWRNPTPSQGGNGFLRSPSGVSVLAPPSMREASRYEVGPQLPSELPSYLPAPKPEPAPSREPREQKPRFGYSARAERARLVRTPVPEEPEPISSDLPAFANKGSQPRFGNWYDEAADRRDSGISVAMSDAWLLERLNASGSFKKEPRNTKSDSVESEEHGQRGPKLANMARPSLARASSMDDLMSVAVAFAEPSPQHRRSIPRAAVHPRKRRWARIGLIALVVLSATAAFGAIATMSLDEAWRDADMEAAEEGVQRGNRSGLLEARERGLHVLDEWPNDVEAKEIVALSDQILHRRFRDEPVALDLVEEGIDSADMRVAQVMLALWTSPEAARAVLDESSPETWNGHEASRDWAEGLIARAQGDWAGATTYLARAVDRYDRPVLPLIDLAEMALSTQHHAAVTAFLDRAPDLERQNTFIPLAHQLLSSDPLHLDSPRMVPVFMSPDGLSPGQRGWYWLAIAWDGVKAGDELAASAAVERGMEESPDNAELQLLSGLLEIRAGDINPGADQLLTGFDGLRHSPRFRRYRAHAVKLLRNAGRPDMVAQILGASPADGLLPGFGTLSADEIEWLLESLVASGHVALAHKAMKQLPAHAPSLVDVQLQLRNLEQTRDIVPLDGEDASGAVPYAAITARTAYARERIVLENTLFGTDWDNAMETASRLSAAYPDKLEPLWIRAELMALDGRAEDAAVLLETQATSGARNVRVEVLGAVLRARAGTLAEPDAATALAAEVTDHLLLNAQAEIAWRSGDRTTARKRLAKVLDANPEDRRALALKGLMADPGHKETLGTLLAGRQGLRSVPGLFPALHTALRMAGQDKAAMVALVNAMHRPWHAAEHAERMARFYTHKGWLKSGRHRLRDTIEILGTSPSTREARGQLAYWLGMLYQPGEGTYMAAKYLKQARELLGEEARILFQLAVYFEAREVKHLAERFYTQAAVIDPAFQR